MVFIVATNTDIPKRVYLVFSIPRSQ